MRKNRGVGFQCSHRCDRNRKFPHEESAREATIEPRSSLLQSAGMRWLVPLLLFCAFPAQADDIERGQKAAKLHCGRCHVVPGGNPFGSIGSTPSFRVLRSYDDWLIRFEGFYAEPPHRAITVIDGLTDPIYPARPSPIAPLEMTETDLKAILAFVETIEPKDVGKLE